MNLFLIFVLILLFYIFIYIKLILIFFFEFFSLLQVAGVDTFRHKSWFRADATRQSSELELAHKENGSFLGLFFDFFSNFFFSFCFAILNYYFQNNNRKIILYFVLKTKQSLIDFIFCFSFRFSSFENYNI